MSAANTSITSTITSRAGTFVLAVAVGAALALGIRAALHGSPPPTTEPTPAPAMDHEGAGHAGHAHSGGTAEQTTAPPTAVEAPAEASVGLLVDLGNAQCPVMGGDVNGKTFSEWNGLRVGHCCPPCRAKFQQNPESLLDETGIPWRDALAAVERVNAAVGEERKRALAEVSATWTIVRDAGAPK